MLALYSGNARGGAHRELSGRGPRRTLDAREQRRLGFPWRPQLVERSRRSAGATLAAATAALDGAGVAANLAGGTHHAHAGHGEGFCVFNDAAVTIRALYDPPFRIVRVRGNMHSPELLPLLEVRDFPLPATVWTVGHSTRTSADFLRLLQANAIGGIADVRRFPGSRRHPHFSAGALADSLRQAGIAYLHLPALGGRRSPREDSRNTAWRNRSLRAYADHMSTVEFAAGMAELCRFAATRQIAVMCAEELWWRCHRALIADWLKAAGVEVVHLGSAGRCQPHPYTSAARLVDGRLVYAAEPGGTYPLFEQ